MLGLSHVAIQVALCGAVSKVPAGTAVPVRVRMAYRVGDPEFEKTFKVDSADGNEAFFEFDIRPGLYRLLIDTPKLGCSGSKFLELLPDRNRKVTIALADVAPEAPRAELLMDGTAPTSFLYTKPTYVLVDKSVTCGNPILTPALAPIEYEYDQGAYYLWMYGDPKVAENAPTVALRLRTPTGLAHYVRVPIAYSEIRGGWPGNVRFDISEDMIDEFATDKTDTLLCPKLWETKTS